MDPDVGGGAEEVVEALGACCCWVLFEVSVTADEEVLVVVVGAALVEAAAAVGCGWWTKVVDEWGGRVGVSLAFVPAALDRSALEDAPSPDILVEVIKASNNSHALRLATQLAVLGTSREARYKGRCGKGGQGFLFLVNLVVTDPVAVT